MKIFKPQELEVILEKHRNWLEKRHDGERANLIFADLRSADLRYANLSYANLRSADLSYANLRSADLSYANLQSADLISTDLNYAHLRNANFKTANLRWANLSYADLSSCDFTHANLRHANLISANLNYANFRAANLSHVEIGSAKVNDIIEDFFQVLDLSKTEVETFYKFVWEGKINGLVYKGKCVCLVGTIANLRKKNFEQMADLEPNAERLAEKWFLGISEGDVPQNSQVSKLTSEWLEHYMIKNDIPIPKREVIWS